ncbi:MAG TPA: alpha/beta family hydrolase [Labilithrix sp.]
MSSRESFQFDVGERGTTTALVYRAKDPIEATLLLAHGAGASQTHPFLVGMAKRIAARGVDVVTFNFLYTEREKRVPDRNDTLEACWRATIASVRARGGLPTEHLFCGGKSMGGRIASQVAAAHEGLTLSGLVFLGYPLHPMGKPRVRRDEHLPRIPFPMLFVQGSRDELGTADEIRAVAKKLPNASVYVVEGGDHSLALRKKDGDTESALDAAADAIAKFTSKHAR